MKYPYIIVKDGIWYPAGTEVPEDTSTYIPETKKKYKKTDINQMKISDLKNLAFENNIENAEELTGSELKKILIELFQL